MKELNLLLQYADNSDNIWLSNQLTTIRDKIKEQRDLTIMSMEALREQLSDCGEWDKVNRLNAMLTEYKDNTITV